LRGPGFVRFFLARFIAYRRVRPAQAIYAQMGGKSPLLELTQAQAQALEDALGGGNVKCFVAMRYWHPFSDATAQAVREWQPDEILLLPLYPQYSTTTTGSSLTAWREAAAKAGLVAPVTSLCCYHSDPAYAAATAALLRRSYDEARAAVHPDIPLRVLFSAHGLPEVIVKRGDPYQFQIERSVAAILQHLDLPELDWVICYQSRATPQRWIGPATDAEVARAAADKVALLVMPIAFVSEHSETLVELGIEYRELAAHLGVPGYFRVPAQNSDPGFIAALAGLVMKTRERGPGLCSFVGGRTCPRPHGDCPHARAEIQTAA
jgi:ferrochelatase